MANSLAQDAQTNNFMTKVVEYDCNGEKVKLSPAIIKNYLVSGGGNVSDEEIVMFLNLCRFQHLNPFLREAYLIKYGNSDATIVTGKEAFTKRAKKIPSYRGFEAGIIVLAKDTKEVKYIEGTFKIPGDELVGGWAKIYIKDFEKPMYNSVSLEEYIGKKKDGTINSQWSNKPATMIRKVALVQALREAFPEDFEGMYSQEEIPVEIDLSEKPVKVSDEELSKAEIKDNKTSSNSNVVEVTIQDDISEAQEILAGGRPFED